MLRLSLLIVFMLECIMSVNQCKSATDQSKVQILHNGWEFKKSDESEWKRALVPGCVHTDLLDNSLIDDPFYRDNEQKLQWIGKTDWFYRLKFKVESNMLNRKHIELVCDGLDTYADVYLNGHPILSADNMFRQWRSECKKYLKAGENILLLRFRSPIDEILPKMESMAYTLPAANDQGEKTSPHTRKAPYHYGWDWGPRFVTCGIWRSIYLETWDMAKIQEMHIIQHELNEKKAYLKVELEILCDSHQSATLELKENSQSTSTNVNLQPGANTVSMDFEIVDPKIWWPNGLGEQPLYTITASLSIDDVEIDAAEKRIGLRTLELCHRKDQWGKSFEFVVNGVRVFAKGGNWIPADNFLNRVTRDRYHWLLKSCKDANMNMLRVWGGGIYEDDIFYDLCDEMGIMVWQDFMFSCGMYPGDEAFLNNVKVEAEYNIKRLRHHPSIALWCGNNEMETGWLHWSWNNRLPESVWEDYEKIFHDILPQACSRCDPSRPYWPSSPSSNGEAEPNAQVRGDVHYWGVWHKAKPFSEYEKQHPRFMSEYGFQAFPSPKTVATYTLPKDRDIESPVMMAHQKHPRGNQLIREYMLRDYREPKDFDSFLIVSQILQAEGIKIGAEHLRRIMPQCMGSLYWQIDDCWPVTSWSSIDYYGRWEALHYYARDFYSPVLVSPHVEEDEVKIYLVSDKTSEIKARLRVVLYDFDGQVLFTHNLDTTVTPLKSAVYWSIPKSELLKNVDQKKVVLWCSLIADGELISTNRLYFVPAKEMHLPKPKINVEVLESETGMELFLQTNKLVRNVHLSTDKYEGFFTNNFFDMIPGKTVRMTFQTDNKVELNEFKADLRVISLVDTY